MMKHLLNAVPLLALGCVSYGAIAQKQASTELNCPEDQVRVEEEGGVRTRLLRAEGCGNVAQYECWDDSIQNPRNGQEMEQAEPVCQLVYSSLRAQAKPRVMSAGESECRRICGGGGDSCRSSCGAGDCDAMCGELERGCIQGCVNALPPEGPSAAAVGTAN
jgi:hypothetical protein